MTNYQQSVGGKNTPNIPQKMFAKDNPWRPFYIAIFMFHAVGYVLYFLSYFLPTPQWGRDLMLTAMPIVQGLQSAVRGAAFYGHDPFPAQVVILYCALVTIGLTVWLILLFFHTPAIREAYLSDGKTLKGKSRWGKSKIISKEIGCICFCLFFLHEAFWSFSATAHPIERQLHSARIDIVSLLLFCSFFFSMFIAVFFLTLSALLMEMDSPRENEVEN